MRKRSAAARTGAACEHPPIRREILVDTNPATAFEVFTDDIGRWWPVTEHSVYGAGGTVAAGPLTDEEGAGMTVLRLPGASQLDEARRLATEEDASVASGFLYVAVRPWKVMLTQG